MKTYLISLTLSSNEDYNGGCDLVFVEITDEYLADLNLKSALAMGLAGLIGPKPGLTTLDCLTWFDFSPLAFDLKDERLVRLHEDLSMDGSWKLRRLDMGGLEPQRTEGERLVVDCLSGELHWEFRQKHLNAQLESAEVNIEELEEQYRLLREVSTPKK